MEAFASFVSTVTSSVVVSSFVRYKFLQEFYKVKFEKARAQRDKKVATQSVSSSSGAVPKSASVTQAATYRPVARKGSSETDSEMDSETDSETDSEKRINIPKPSSTSTPDTQPTFPIGTMYDEVKNTLSLSTSEVIDFMNIHNIVISAIEAAAKQLTYSKEKANETQPSAKDAPVAPVQAAPVQAAPVQTAPVQAAPVQAAPVQAAPVQTAPVQTAPVQAAPVVPEETDDLTKYFAEKIQSPDAQRTSTIDGFSIHLHSSPSSARRAIAKRKAVEKAEQTPKKRKKTKQAVRKQAVPRRTSAIKFKHARDTPYPKGRARGHTFAEREVRALKEKIRGGLFKRTLIREFYNSEGAKDDGMFKTRTFRSYQQMVYRMKHDMGCK